MFMTKLAYLRKKKGLTQDEMAKILTIGLSTYNQYENLQRGIPIQIAEKIASILDITVDEIFLPIKFTVSKTRVEKGEQKA
jgi:putative transcriptional regulator